MTPDGLVRMHLVWKQEVLCQDVTPISGDTLEALAYSYVWTYPTTAEVLMQCLWLPWAMEAHLFQYFVIMWPDSERN